MFVRNNISCPACGKSRTFDMFLALHQPDSGMVVVAECYHCLSQWQGWVCDEHLRYVVRDAAQLHPRMIELKPSIRWSDHCPLRLSKSQKMAVRSVCLDLFCQNQVYGGFLERCPVAMSTLCGWLLGSPIESSRFNAVASLFRPRAVQPLAS